MAAVNDFDSIIESAMEALRSTVSSFWERLSRQDPAPVDTDSISLTTSPEQPKGSQNEGLLAAKVRGLKSTQELIDDAAEKTMRKLFAEHLDEGIGDGNGLIDLTKLKTLNAKLEARTQELIDQGHTISPEMQKVWKDVLAHVAPHVLEDAKKENSQYIAHDGKQDPRLAMPATPQGETGKDGAAPSFKI